jgi:hypothetical protein
MKLFLGRHVSTPTCHLQVRFLVKIIVPCTYIKMDLRETGWDGGDWIDLAQDMGQWRALVNAVMNVRVP